MMRLFNVWHWKVLRILTLLLLLPLLASATTSFCSPSIDWLGYSVIALIISMTIYSIMYMVGSLLERPQIHAMVKSGVSDVAALAVIVIVAFAINNFMCGATPSSLGINFSSLRDYTQLDIIGADPNDVPVIKLGEAYLKILYYEGEKLYKSLFIQMLYAGALTSVKVGAGSTMGTIQPFAGFEPILNFAPLLMSSASILLISISAQFYLLKFIEYTGLSLFFPLGVLLRAIPPTRSFGGALMGLVFAMYFVYPLILSYNFYVLVNVVKPNDALINSYLYNAPTCSEDLECNSNKCVHTNQGNFCEPCILTGDVPEGANPSICCSKVSFYDQNSGQCKINPNLDTGDPNGFGKGGIIAKGTSTPDYGLTMFIGVSTTLALISSILSRIPYFSNVAGSLSGIIMMVLSIKSAFILSSLSFIVNPIVVFIVLVLMNNVDFFFVGMILPIIEFITIIEFTRTLTASMGEPIDLIQVIRVV